MHLLGCSHMLQKKPKCNLHCVLWNRTFDKEEALLGCIVMGKRHTVSEQQYFIFNNQCLIRIFYHTMFDVDVLQGSEIKAAIFHLKCKIRTFFDTLYNIPPHCSLYILGAKIIIQGLVIHMVFQVCGLLLFMCCSSMY